MFCSDAGKNFLHSYQINFKLAVCLFVVVVVVCLFLVVLCSLFFITTH